MVSINESIASGSMEPAGSGDCEIVEGSRGVSGQAGTGRRCALEARLQGRPAAERERAPVGQAEAEAHTDPSQSAMAGQCRKAPAQAAKLQQAGHCGTAVDPDRRRPPPTIHWLLPVPLLCCAIRPVQPAPSSARKDATRARCQLNTLCTTWPAGCMAVQEALVGLASLGL